MHTNGFECTPKIETDKKTNQIQITGRNYCPTQDKQWIRKENRAKVNRVQIMTETFVAAIDDSMQIILRMKYCPKRQCTNDKMGTRRRGREGKRESWKKPLDELEKKWRTTEQLAITLIEQAWTTSTITHNNKKLWILYKVCSVRNMMW